MLGPLPEFVDPFRLACQQIRMRGAIPVAAMTRMAALVRDDSGLVEVVLRFRMPASGVPRADGSARLTAHLTCQRCLDPLDIELAPELKVAFTDGDDAVERAELAAGYEPLECGGRIGLTTMVEDEILLALPDFPTHRAGLCTVAGEAGAPDPGDSPFSSLRDQLQQTRT
jgi:uncharacterized protein